MITVVVLPGLDGIGRLRCRFADALSARQGVELVSYPHDRPLGYAELQPIVTALMSRHERVVLLGESFSGPLACMIAAERPAGLIGLVLCASFARAPIPRALAPLIEGFPLQWIPQRGVEWALFGKWHDAAVAAELRDALHGVGLPALRSRARSVAHVDVRACLASIGVPTLCLRAHADRIVSARASEELRASLRDVRSIEVDGPHALLQAMPEVCAQHVADFSESLAPRT